MLALLTAALGAVVVLVMLGRVVDVRFLRTRRWPGTFSTGSPQQRASVVGLSVLGLGFVLLGAGEAVGPSNKALAGALLVAAMAIMVVAIALFARAAFMRS